ncbi:carbohydrate ABC transporter substrate-binding protein (CUT1 family) [Halanaerobium saccharolyticum]|jgi:sn-glycerol 3-phosphate transport system substrate-binding protein|uniref:Carbohydrate ABC transporter substrate-binding protein (CUT1 family) n=1 Tax=Halanaerobium saccharolyticum TaxID=43595 RepID=A0A2T5RT95_9FIRM|nr:ABC transporter substrate-binding protein [Halanaerobium saccharolyticum]PTW03552.1 carbohydrate ABC transporter substrate-binding protein (CUT1 family) [Halanaerobium saccharolyticum]
MLKKSIIILTLVTLFAFSAAMVSAQTIELEFWHAMSGGRTAAVEKIVDGFNAEHDDINVTAQFTGSYAETLTQGISAVRSGNPPHIIQVYEVGTQTMLDSEAIVPVYEIAEGKIDFGSVIQPILNYYSVDGKLYSMPFNSSTAMLYYNKDAFAAAGIETVPETWADIEEMGLQIIDSGAANHGLSFGWPAWILEQMHAYHNKPYANNDNGRSGRASEVYLDRDFAKMVLGTWTDLVEKDVVAYGGREYSANQDFLAGEVAMLIQSTSSLSSIMESADFEVGTTFLPRFEGQGIGNSVIGGASLWVMQGHSDEEYEAVVEFFKYLSKTDVTIQWHKDTGYFPSTNAAVKTLMDDRWFSDNPNYLTAFLQVLSGVQSPAANGVLLGNFVEIRDIVDTAVEESLYR